MGIDPAVIGDLPWFTHKWAFSHDNEDYGDQMRLINQKWGLKNISGRFNWDNANGDITSQNGDLIDKNGDVAHTADYNEDSTKNLSWRIQCHASTKAEMCKWIATRPLLSIPTVVNFPAIKGTGVLLGCSNNSFGVGTKPYPGTTTNYPQALLLGQQPEAASRSPALGLCRTKPLLEVEKAILSSAINSKLQREISQSLNWWYLPVPCRKVVRVGIFWFVSSQPMSNLAKDGCSWTVDEPVVPQGQIQPEFHWIGLRENIQETLAIFLPSILGGPES